MMVQVMAHRNFSLLMFGTKKRKKKKKKKKADQRPAMTSEELDRDITSLLSVILRRYYV